MIFLQSFVSMRAVVLIALIAACSARSLDHLHATLQTEAQAGAGPGVAFAGGGHLSVASQAGLLAGLAAGTTTKTVAELMAKVAAISSNSGGSWFATELLFSAQFNTLLNGLAASDESQGRYNMFNVAYAQPLQTLGTSEQPVAILNPVKACCGSKPLLGCSVGYVFQTGFSTETLAADGTPYCCPTHLLGENGEKESLIKKKPESCVAATNYISCGLKTLNEQPAWITVDEEDFCCEALNQKMMTETLKPKTWDDWMKEVCRVSAENSVQSLAMSGLNEEWEFIRKFLAKGLQWDQLTENILNIFSDVNAKGLLNGTPVPWANGKDYLSMNAIMSPNRPGDFVFLAHDVSRTEDTKTVLKYKATTSGLQDVFQPCNGKLCGDQLPAIFSVTLGSPNSPVPLTSAAVKEKLAFQYDAFDATWGNSGKSIKTETSSAPTAEGIWTKTHTVPRVSAAAGSSAFLGSMSQFGFTQNLLGTHIDFVFPSRLRKLLSRGTVPFSLVPGESMAAAFTEARTFIDNRDTGNLAAKNVVALTDGGQIDNSAVAPLVVAGKTDIVAVMAVDAGVVNFAAKNYKSEVVLLRLLGASFPETDMPPEGKAGYQIFKETSEEITAQAKNFKTVAAPTAAKDLAGIRYGTIQMTTVESKAYGITAGKVVNVHCVCISAHKSGDSTLGPAAWYLKTAFYASLVDEIVDLFKNNLQMGKDIRGSFGLAA